MAIWNPRRNPNKFPAVWHSALMAPPGEHLLAIVGIGDDIEVKRLRYRFAAFKASLRAHPSSETAKRLALLSTVIKTESSATQTSVWLETKWSIAVLMRNAQDFPPDH